MRLMHAEHGYHVTSNSAELAEMFKAGWKECTDEQFAEIMANKVRKEPLVVNESVKRGPGRPKKAE